MKFYLVALGIILFSACRSNTPPDETPGKNETPEQALIQLTEQYPDSLLLWEDLIQYYRENGLTDKAIQTADKVIEKDTTIARFWYIRGTLYNEMDSIKPAIESLERSLAIYPTEQALRSLGSIYANAGNNKALHAADMLETLRESKDIAAQFIRGNYFYHSGNADRALAYYDSCINMSYTFMPAYTEKGFILMERKEYAKAKDVFAKAVTVQNNFQEGYGYLGAAYIKLNDVDNAIEAYRMALLYDRNDHESKRIYDSLLSVNK